ncbi:MAG: hypothetical protein JWN70_3102 [Planctomycetaceae bacterium]|nr:hypothetical protein [Planctomycetaceae bacterium]
MGSQVYGVLPLRGLECFASWVYRKHDCNRASIRG